MTTTYRVMQVLEPGVLQLAERTRPEPGKGQVVIDVEACGICGADIFDIDNVKPNLSPPRVPGHEVIGRIVALGTDVPNRWSIGQRVGVGRLGGPCYVCDFCRQGHFQQCSDQPVVGSSMDGGYAEVMLVRASGLVSIPDELNSIEAAPILCAGVATFNALKKCGAQAGDTVAVLGVGGLGHMAIQYAKRMGYKVVAIGRGDDIRQMALALGAHEYVDTNKQPLDEELQRIGYLDAAIVTINESTLTTVLFNHLSPNGKMVILGAGKAPLVFSSGAMVSGERHILGSITGTPYENEKALNFSVLAQVKPMIETMPFEHANEAFQIMKSGKANFRIVLTMKN
ncbi:alcohol dehydrogenase catalytic domain-containing protein [Providencia stuartii]|uniref:alcohol dehydrogenase catalytic domain-containing protein n=1 Tax=Providencia stuartii TaxID=588 RepID=UPI0033346225